MVTNVAHACRKNSIFGEKKIRFVTALDLIKCRIQVKQQRLLVTCAPISELPFDIITMSHKHVESVKQA